MASGMIGSRVKDMCLSFGKKAFSTSARLSKACDKRQSCDVPKCPCMTVAEIVEQQVMGKIPKPDGENCERLCMPCCAPGRYPPICVFPFWKAKCKKIPPPRPSFSECQRRKFEFIPPCECDPPLAPVCKVEEP